MKITRVDRFAVEVPQAAPIAPYQSRYRETCTTKAVLIRIETDNGIVGWGETPQRYLGEPISGRVAIELRTTLAGIDPREIDALYPDVALDGAHVQSAVEIAGWDITGKVRGQPLYELLGGQHRCEISRAACMGIQPPSEAAKIAKLYVNEGFRAIRDAVGDHLEPQQRRIPIHTPLRRPAWDFVPNRIQAVHGTGSQATKFSICRWPNWACHERTPNFAGRAPRSRPLHRAASSRRLRRQSPPQRC